MTKHDYAAALKLLQIQNVDLVEEEHKAAFHATIHALKLAQKIMEEPSDSMSKCGDEATSEYLQNALNPTNAHMLSVGYPDKMVFKAMRNQMLKEIE